MMGLTYRDVLTVIAIAAVWTIAVSVLALAAIRLGRRAPSPRSSPSSC